jgi:hypothetical protein
VRSCLVSPHRSRTWRISAPHCRWLCTQAVGAKGDEVEDARRASMIGDCRIHVSAAFHRVSG